MQPSKQDYFQTIYKTKTIIMKKVFAVLMLVTVLGTASVPAQPLLKKFSTYVLKHGEVKKQWNKYTEKWEYVVSGKQLWKTDKITKVFSVAKFTVDATDGGATATFVFADSCKLQGYVDKAMAKLKPQ